jgi:hypothetical protein
MNMPKSKLAYHWNFPGETIRCLCKLNEYSLRDPMVWAYAAHQKY